MDHLHNANADIGSFILQNIIIDYVCNTFETNLHKAYQSVKVFSGVFASQFLKTSKKKMQHSL